MAGGNERLEQVLIWTAVVAAGLIHISIAGSQIALGFGTLLLLITQKKLPFPRIWVPLLCLFLWTLTADLVSGHAWAGRPQIRKFFVFLFLPLMYAVFRKHFEKARYVLYAWFVAATASGVWGLVQFVQKYQAALRAHQVFYEAYVGRRITGFESHWMTFGALQLSVLSMLLGHWFFAKRKLPAWIYVLSGSVLGCAIVLGWTRSIWIATVPALLYLVWQWRPKMVIFVPVLLGLALLVAPGATRDRLLSLVDPHGETDSNRHRIVTFRTGIEMIRAHPLFGIGPEEIGPQFDSYVPSDIKRPLPVGYYGHLHNIYLQYSAERGIPALLFVLWMVGQTVWDSVRALRRTAKISLASVFLHGAIAVIIGVLVGGCFEYNLGDSEVLMMFVCALGLAYAAVEETSAARQSSSSALAKQSV